MIKLDDYLKHEFQDKELPEGEHGITSLDIDLFLGKNIEITDVLTASIDFYDNVKTFKGKMTISKFDKYLENVNMDTHPLGLNVTMMNDGRFLISTVNTHFHA